MQLVDAHWRSVLLFGAAIAHPTRVVPLVTKRAHNGAGFWRRFVHEAEGVGLIDGVPGDVGSDVEFIYGTFGGLWHCHGPDATAADGLHGVGATIPVIEIAYDRYVSSVGCPDGEPHAAVGQYVGAELAMKAVVGAFIEKKLIVSSQIKLARETLAREDGARRLVGRGRD